MKRLLLTPFAVALLSTAACTVDSVASNEEFDTEACPACAEADYHLQITAEPGLAADLSLIYQSRSDSWGCTDLAWDMLNPKRVPEQYREEVAPMQCTQGAEGEQICDFAFSDARGDDCGSTIQHVYVAPTDDTHTAEPWASLSAIDRADYDNEPQIVECTESGGVINCGNDLLYYGATGRARIHLVWSR
ncbi:MAG: hypothetical protein JRI23_06275 [Deltaproteobacteria bacterium]|jgi:hypothetical protein|nr:hypothetical protein [Deltaproteobacteria bacterium]MBW2531180.1 hypothetical protein [Deltaproteobacteria bacterium]